MVTTMLTTAFLPASVKRNRVGAGAELKCANSQKNREKNVKKRENKYTK
jgi:hypothetical protein